jgi:SH3-like domain-containing protein
MAGRASRWLPAALLAAGLSWPAAAGAETLCVTAGKANLRSGPGTAYRITWEVPRHMPLVEAAREGDWIKVRDLDGDIHWVFSGAVTKTARCAVVKTEKAHLRKEPGAKAAALRDAARHECFRLDGEKGGWLKLDVDGKPAWVAASDVWTG